jgi:hypothetical protein
MTRLGAEVKHGRHVLELAGKTRCRARVIFGEGRRRNDTGFSHVVKVSGFGALLSHGPRVRSW